MYLIRKNFSIADKVPWKEELRSIRNMLDHFDDIILRIWGNTRTFLLLKSSIFLTPCTSTLLWRKGGEN